jgi:DNA invertase Pin-like site-specific DNA recombinase
MARKRQNGRPPNTPNTKFVAYYRVSTDRQGASGLGLDAQRSLVAKHVAAGHLVAEFQEIESGKIDKRPQLQAALENCRDNDATLVIAKLDRLARDALFILTLMKGDVEFVACDMPQANRMVLQLLAVIAEGEREAISARTKAALEVAKARGTRLGNPRWEESIERARAARNGNPVPLAVVSQIKRCREDGWPLRRIACHLNAMDVRTPRGCKWHPETVKAVLKRELAGSYDQSYFSVTRREVENVG